MSAPLVPSLFASCYILTGAIIWIIDQILYAIGFVIPPILGAFVDVLGPAGYARGFFVYVVLGVAATVLAIAFVLRHPAVTSPIIGPRTMQHLTGSLRALEIKINKASLKQLDEIWPGPGGEAPEAYAW